MVSRKNQPDEATDEFAAADATAMIDIIIVDDADVGKIGGR